MTKIKKKLSKKAGERLIDPHGDRQQGLLKQLLPKWKKNAIANYQFATHGRSITELEIKKKNEKVPLIVTGSGPTLDNFIDQCKKLYPQLKEGRQLVLPIISSTSSLNPLIANSILPSIVIAYDSSPFLIEHFKNLRTHLYALVVPTSIHPAVLYHWEGPVYFFNLFQHNHPFFTSFLPELYPNFIGVANSGCVSNVSVRIALSIWGFEPILLAGVDNGYPDDKAWCTKYRMSRFNGKWEVDPSSDNYVINHDWECEGIKTRTEFVTYRECLYAIMKEHPNKVYNLTPGGINTEIPIAQLKDFNIKNIK